MNTIVWLREDLRLFDNPALSSAAQQGSVVPVYIYPEDLGAASYWWLHHSLLALRQSLAEQNVPLILRSGDPVQVINQLCEEINSEKVVWNRVYSPAGILQGQQLKDSLDNTGRNHQSFNGQLLIEPTRIATQQGTPFKVFTPFWRKCLSELAPEPLLEVPRLTACDKAVVSESLESWQLLPNRPNWAAGFSQYWQPGETGAQQRLSGFLDSTIDQYKEGRDIPSQQNTSLLSPHLAFGEISPRQIWFDTHQAIAQQRVRADNGNKFLSQIGWREFSRYLLVHFPELLDQPFNQRFNSFPWQDAPALVTAWQRGQTGYPIVDAGMRELWQTGYMHNRVRMIVASFLTKHCLTHWEVGMQWFWDTLVDADIANNTASWQWASGCGADAAPYFRIFNPILQGEKFDKQGTYVKRWVPELSELPNKFIHKPWEADRMILQHANIILGQDYPNPVVDHRAARQLALDSYQAIKVQNLQSL